jgi:peptide deformylase
VESFDSALRDLADEMLSLMQHHRGIGLAAPQVGLRQRLMVSRIEDHLLVLANLEVKDFGEPRDFVRPSCSKNANTDPAQTGGGEDKTSERYE